MDILLIGCGVLLIGGGYLWFLRSILTAYSLHREARTQDIAQHSVTVEVD